MILLCSIQISSAVIISLKFEHLLQLINKYIHLSRKLKILQRHNETKSLR